ncbi:hypothetical protein ACC862_03450 [Rhizobium ruizarguesonis]
MKWGIEWQRKTRALSSNAHRRHLDGRGFAQLLEELQFLYDVAQFGQMRFDGQHPVSLFGFFRRRFNQRRYDPFEPDYFDEDWGGRIIRASCGVVEAAVEAKRTSGRSTSPNTDGAGSTSCAAAFPARRSRRLV